MGTVTIFKSNEMNKEVFYQQDTNGLKVYVIPDKNSQRVEIDICTKYGSMDRMYRDRINNEMVVIPQGTAHFLEHKMFEMPNESTSELMGRLTSQGIEVNAATSIDYTVYYASTYNQWVVALKNLMEIVFTPYFTDENIAKELGIIKSEIRISKDTRNSKKNILNVMYENDFVCEPILGTTESIEKITKETLYSVHRNYYVPSNMCIIVYGNVVPGEVFSKVREYMKPFQEKEVFKTDRCFLENKLPTKINLEGKKKKNSLAKAQIGFSIRHLDKTEKLECMIAAQIFNVINFSRMSEFANSLVEENVINELIGLQMLNYQNICVPAIFAETKCPYKFKRILLMYLQELKEKNINISDFNIAKKVMYAGMLREYEDEFVQNIIQSFMLNTTPFKDVDLLQEITAEKYKELVSKIFNTREEVYMYFER